jgi:hypothetical protein
LPSAGAIKIVVLSIAKLSDEHGSVAPSVGGVSADEQSVPIDIIAMLVQEFCWRRRLHDVKVNKVGAPHPVVVKLTALRRAPTVNSLWFSSSLRAPRVQVSGR